MIHLKSISLKPSFQAKPVFPFNTPVIASLGELHLGASVTFLVGENGSGKSTLLEAIACGAKSITVGAESVETDPSLAPMRLLAKDLKLVWANRTRRGFYMRAEDFFGYAKRMAQMRADLQADLEQVETDYADRSDYAKSLARMAYVGELGAIENYYGDGLDSESHGESFFKLFQARFVPNGLYLLDEPEAPLSPMRQLTFLAMLHEMVLQNAQFIIATHSPILMAYPDAQILSFDGGQVVPMAYEDLEHVTVMRSFLNDPQRYLRYLLGR